MQKRKHTKKAAPIVKRKTAVAARRSLVKELDRAIGVLIALHTVLSQQEEES